MSFVLGLQQSQRRLIPIKTRVIWVPDTHMKPLFQGCMLKIHEMFQDDLRSAWPSAVGPSYIRNALSTLGTLGPTFCHGWNLRLRYLKWRIPNSPMEKRRTWTWPLAREMFTVHLNSPKIISSISKFASWWQLNDFYVHPFWNWGNDSQFHEPIFSNGLGKTHHLE